MRKRRARHRRQVHVRHYGEMNRQSRRRRLSAATRSWLKRWYSAHTFDWRAAIDDVVFLAGEVHSVQVIFK